MTKKEREYLSHNLSYHPTCWFIIRLRAVLSVLAFCWSVVAMPMKAPTYKHYVVVGGGVCGVSCCQTIAQEENCRVTLVASKGLLKGVANVVKMTRNIDSFEIVDQVILCNFKTFSKLVIK